MRKLIIRLIAVITMMLGILRISQLLLNPQADIGFFSLHLGLRGIPYGDLSGWLGTAIILWASLKLFTGWFVFTVMTQLVLTPLEVGILVLWGKIFSLVSLSVYLLLLLIIALNFAIGYLGFNYSITKIVLPMSRPGTDNVPEKHKKAPYLREWNEFLVCLILFCIPLAIPETFPGLLPISGEVGKVISFVWGIVAGYCAYRVVVTPLIVVPPTTSL